MSLTLHADGSVSAIALTAPCGTGAGDGREGTLSGVSISRPHVVHSSLLPQQQASASFTESLTGQKTESTGEHDERKNGKVPQKPDDRTWLQKNWLFVALAFFIFANKLGAAAEASRAPSGARPAGGGAR